MDPYDPEEKSYGECERCNASPSWMSWGWLASPYTWFLLIFSLLIVFASIYFSSYDNEWYNSLTKPPGMIPDYAFSIIWGVLYTGIIIAIIMVAWPTNRPCISAIVVTYVIILFMTLLWVFLFNQFHQLIGAAVVIVLIIPVIVYLLWLIWPRKCEHLNWFRGYFPVVMFMLLLGWIIVASYYSVYFAAVNSS